MGNSYPFYNSRHYAKSHSSTILSTLTQSFSISMRSVCPNGTRHSGRPINLLLMHWKERKEREKGRRETKPLPRYFPCQLSRSLSLFPFSPYENKYAHQTPLPIKIGFLTFNFFVVQSGNSWGDYQPCLGQSVSP